MRSASYIISSVFHPLIIPLFALFILLHSDTYLALYPTQIDKLLTLLLFLSGSVLPYSTVQLIRSLRFYSNNKIFKYNNLLPFWVTLISYILAFFLLIKLPFNVDVHILKIVITAFLLVNFKIFSTRFFEINSHVLSYGALTGMLLYFTIAFKSDNFYWFVAVIAIGGIGIAAQIVTKQLSFSKLLVSYLSAGILSFTIYTIG